MTPTEILHKIVETENKARDIYNTAVEMQTDFDVSVNSAIDDLKKKYAAVEEKNVSAAEKEAVSQAEQEINRLDKKLEAELASVKQQYNSHKEGYLDKLFKRAVNADA